MVVSNVSMAIDCGRRGKEIYESRLNVSEYQILPRMKEVGYGRGNQIWERKNREMGTRVNDELIT